MTLISSFDGSFLLPGQLPSVEAIEQDLTSVIWQPLHRAIVGANAMIDGAARDAGNTGFTDVLRPGLLLTKTAAGKFIQWGAVVSKAVDPIEGVLLLSMKMTRSGTNTDRFMGHILLGGFVKINGLIIPGNADAGIVGDASEELVRSKMLFSFTFDDDTSKSVGQALFGAQFQSSEGIPLAAPQALSGAGAINVTSYYTGWTTTAAQAGTLADGTFVGQRKLIRLVADGGDGTLTPVNLAGGTTIVFSNVGDQVMLIWDGTDWNVVERGNVASGAGATPVVA